MSTFITTAGAVGSGTRVAIKDLIDLAGYPTTAGCRAVAARAQAATADAACLTGLREAEQRGEATVVGKVNLHELAFGTSGLNPWFGNPVNPLDPSRIPGGSSSGSAVAVATDQADVAYGSDTGGSVRIPSACCGTAGLKTTWGRVSLEGVWPLSGMLDTIGPMARDVDGLVKGMELLEPGFRVSDEHPRVIGRLRRPDTDPAIDAAIDRLLATSELEVVEVTLGGWEPATQVAIVVLLGEAWASDRGVLERDPDGVSAEIRARLELAATIDARALADARAHRGAWQAELTQTFERVEAIALPTLRTFAPRIGEDSDATAIGNAAVNLGGNPSLALPVPSGGPLPASVQLIGPLGGEDRLLAAGRVLEAAAASLAAS